MNCAEGAGKWPYPPLSFVFEMTNCIIEKMLKLDKKSILSSCFSSNKICITSETHIFDQAKILDFAHLKNDVKTKYFSYMQMFGKTYL